MVSSVRLRERAAWSRGQYTLSPIYHHRHRNNGSKCKPYPFFHRCHLRLIIFQRSLLSLLCLNRTWTVSCFSRARHTVRKRQRVRCFYYPFMRIPQSQTSVAESSTVWGAFGSRISFITVVIPSIRVCASMTFARTLSKSSGK